MSAIGGWIGSGAGVVLIGLCVIASMFLHHLPGITHPVLKRFMIAGMYCGGAALAVTTIGGWAHQGLEWVFSLAGGTTSGLGRATLILAATFLAGTVLAGLLFAPDWTTGIIAACLPFVLGLAAGGVLLHAYQVTTYPAQSAAEAIARGLGG
jgi:hypothetical protein